MGSLDFLSYFHLRKGEKRKDEKIREKKRKSESPPSRSHPFYSFHTRRPVWDSFHGPLRLIRVYSATCIPFMYTTHLFYLILDDCFVSLFVLFFFKNFCPPFLAEVRKEKQTDKQKKNSQSSEGLTTKFPRFMSSGTDTSGRFGAKKVFFFSAKAPRCVQFFRF